MTKRHSKGADGKYHINGKKFEVLTGSRAQVWHETAYKTSGGLTRFDLMQNKNGRIVSRKKHNTAKKGKFGAVRLASARHSTGKTRKRRSSSKRKTV